ncbi:unnamed protein product, partial [Aphanomyces euteiches]|uniref:Uncharacterized protein n=1 Tax=Aphanomyces euteiches TaxID=100861 RepID=A0A6G0X5N4_9STRA|nr:hypothetical protein Ae201684_008156 [Aphanomyces euteiches]KAH9070520.1 hypothetical protein Ae201684P_002877 [Aphanomyces euteiches]KAH9155370.1 hypothetical protein AeRB84_002646 [Aphanomyces euteiches]
MLSPSSIDSSRGRSSSLKASCKSPSEGSRSGNSSPTNEGDGRGRWTPEEHERFMQAVAMYPCGPWKLIGAIVKTRSIRQIQTHAQKLREKAARHNRGLKIKVKDQMPAMLPPYFLGRDESRVEAQEEEEETDEGLPSLDDCLDYFLANMDIA